MQPNTDKPPGVAMATASQRSVRLTRRWHAGPAHFSSVSGENPSLQPTGWGQKQPRLMFNGLVGLQRSSLCEKIHLSHLHLNAKLSAGMKEAKEQTRKLPGDGGETVRPPGDSRNATGFIFGGGEVTQEHKQDAVVTVTIM